jgi:hypothetical protein
MKRAMGGVTDGRPHREPDVELTESDLARLPVFRRKLRTQYHLGRWSEAIRAETGQERPWVV